MKIRKKFQCLGVVFCVFNFLTPVAAIADSDWSEITPASLALLRALADVDERVVESTEDSIAAARQRFEAVDRNGDGVQLTDLLYRTQLLDAAKTYANIEQLFHTDLNQDGRAERREMARFVQLYSEQFSGLLEPYETRVQLAERLADIAMRKYDRNDDGYITRVEAMAVERDSYEAVRSIAYSQVEDEFQVWLSFDRNGDAVVTFAEVEPHLRQALKQRAPKPQASVNIQYDSWG